jgi:hypothetical protein
MDGAMGIGVRIGNAADESADRGGWFVGHFIGRPDHNPEPRRTGAVEVKWGVHPAGQGRRAVATNARATTLSVLVRGRFRLRFPHREAVLVREGDYALWGPGIAHDWLAEEDSIVLTVRWPSLPTDSSEAPAP